jgi:hypothetical protein
MSQIPFSPNVAMESSRTPQQELRSVVRHLFQRPVSLKGVFAEELDALNLSLRGIGIRSPLRLGEGRLVELAFLERSVSVRGVVRHETKTESSDLLIGIEFLDPQPELVEVALLLSGAGA